MQIFHIADKLKGGKGDDKTVEDLAKKHDVSEQQICDEIKAGIKVEKEHTDDSELAREIVMDHLDEYPDYYTNSKHGLLVQEKKLD